MMARGGLVRLKVVFFLGFFSLVAQTLLFRVFLGVFDGNELFTGLFFFFWLVWICAGSASAAVFPARVPRSLRWFSFFVLAYIPSFAVQFMLLDNAGSLAGTASFEVFSLSRAAALLFFSNAPVSFMTGFLFVLASLWMRGEGAVSKVYAWEAAGSFAGAVLVTLALWLGAAPASIFLVAACLLVFSLLVCEASAARPGAWRVCSFALLLLLMSLCVFFGGGESLRRRLDRASWERCFPGAELYGSFQTSQASYSLGSYKGQFVVAAWGAVVDALPNVQNTTPLMASALVWNPSARRVLVVGPGSLSLSLRFAALPGVEAVTWLCPDPAFAQKLVVSSPRHGFNYSKLSVPDEDPRVFAASCGEKFDLIALDIGAPSSIVLNRYFTLESHMLLKGLLAPGGVLCVRFPGGENFVGAETALLGASVARTMEAAFSRTALKPGGASLLLGFKDDSADASPGLDVMERRLRSVEGLASMFAPENVNMLYNPGAAALQSEACRRLIDGSRDPDGDFLNTDLSPKSCFYCLLSLARKLGGFANADAGAVLRAGRLLPFFVAALVFLFPVMRVCVFLFSRRRFSSDGGFSGGASWHVVFSASCSCMILDMLLVFAYQTAFGTLFLDYGMLTAFFMLGSFAGAAASWRFPRGGGLLWVTALCLVHAAFCLLAWFLLPCSSRVLFFALLFAAGAVGGAYVPLCVRLFGSAPRMARRASSMLGVSDYFGGAVGALVASLVLIPFAGAGGAFAVSALLPLSVLLAIPFPPRNPLSRTGRWIFAFVFVLLASLIVAGFAWSVFPSKNGVPVKDASDNPALRLLDE